MRCNLLKEFSNCITTFHEKSKEVTGGGDPITKNVLGLDKKNRDLAYSSARVS